MNEDETIPPTNFKSQHRQRHYKYFDLVMAGFVTVLVCSNLIGPAKLCLTPLPFALPLIGSQLKFGAGNLFFPIGYIFGDILTEVYGYARARKVIWAGFGALLFATFMSQIIVHIPGVTDDAFQQDYQAAAQIMFGNTWRIVLASIVAYWVGDFVNSYVLARMKLWTGGKHLWTRTIGSTIVGQGVDSLIFYPIAFAGIWTNQDLRDVLLFNWGLKVSVEVLFTPLTYLVVNFLKRAEAEDYYDYDTNFSPFTLDD